MFHCYDPSDSRDALGERLTDQAPPPEAVVCLKVKRHVLYSDDRLTASRMRVLWVKFGFEGNFYVEGHTTKINLMKPTNPNLKRSHILLIANASGVTTVRYCMFRTDALVYRNVLVGYMSF